MEDLVAACLDAELSGDRAACELLLEEQPALAAAARAQLADLATTGLLESPPESIGPYRVLLLLGRGGMGEVYLAEQREPVQRRVAVKLVKRGMDTREVLARFHAERQALARMSHASIARVYDAGSTPDGRPYFAMEYVDGLPLTAYCDRKALSTEERLQLFAELCEAVQHAHWKGVLHRDLKPSNLLVTEVDGKSVPKVIDFGIAKALDEEAQSATLHTARGAILGTPEYMSPEQASGASGDLDLRSDVYSLGVVLYELLTGDLPLAPRGSRRDLEEWLRALREETPSLPSRRFAREESETSARARARRATTRELRRRLHGDLDWICAKALAKEREERYATVGELAADLRRHLAHEPVLAGPPSGLYRLRKFVRRYRWQVGAAALLFLSLIGGLIATSLYRWRAERSLQSEQLARRAAEQDFSRAISAIEALVQSVDAGRLDGIPEAEPVRIRILEDAARFCTAALAQHPGDPRIVSAAALVKYARAKLAQDMSDLDLAAETCRDGLAMVDAALTAHPEKRELALRRIDLLTMTLIVRHAASREVEDAELLSRIEESLQNLIAQDPTDSKALIRRLQFHVNLASSRVERGHATAASSLEQARSTLAMSRGREELATERLRAEQQMAQASAQHRMQRNELAEAERDLVEYEQSIASTPSQSSEDVLRARFWLGYLRCDLHLKSKRPAEAERLAREALADATRLRGEHSAVPLYRALVGVAHGSLGLCHEAQKRGADALREMRTAFDILEPACRAIPAHDGMQFTMGIHAKNFASIVLAQRSHADAERAALAARVAVDRLRRRSTQSPRDAERFAETLRINSDLERCIGESERAIALMLEQVELLRAERDIESLPKRDLEKLALLNAQAALEASRAEDLELGSSRLSEAETWVQRAIAGDAKATGPRVAKTLLDLARARGALRRGELDTAYQNALEFAKAAGKSSYEMRALGLQQMLRVARAAEGEQRASIGSEVGQATGSLTRRMADEPKLFARVSNLADLRREYSLLHAVALAIGGEKDDAWKLLEEYLPAEIEKQRTTLDEASRQDRLALFLEVRAELALEREALEAAKAAWRELASLRAPAWAIEAARRASAAGEVALALELLEARAAHSPELRAEHLDTPALASIAEEPRFLALRQTLAQPSSTR